MWLAMTVPLLLYLWIQLLNHWDELYRKELGSRIVLFRSCGDDKWTAIMDEDAPPPGTSLRQRIEELLKDIGAIIIE